MAAGAGGKMFGIPMDLFGVSWFGNVAAMTAFAIGSLVKGSVIPAWTAAISADGTAPVMISYLPHGIMIGAGLISLIQCGRMLLKKSDGNSAAGKFSSSMANMKKALGGGYVAYLIVQCFLQ